MLSNAFRALQKILIHSQSISRSGKSWRTLPATLPGGYILACAGRNGCGSRRDSFVTVSLTALNFAPLAFSNGVSRASRAATPG